MALRIQNSTFYSPSCLYLEICPRSQLLFSTLPTTVAINGGYILLKEPWQQRPKCALCLKKKRTCASSKENGTSVCPEGRRSAPCDLWSLFVQCVTTWICFWLWRLTWNTPLLPAGSRLFKGPVEKQVDSRPGCQSARSHCGVHGQRGAHCLSADRLSFSSFHPFTFSGPFCPPGPSPWLDKVMVLVPVCDGVSHHSRKVIFCVSRLIVLALRPLSLTVFCSLFKWVKWW